MMALPEFIVLDVGHGNCVLLRDTQAVTIMDCAPGATLIETLTHLGLHDIHHVLISHADSDHIGGIIGLLLHPSFIVHNVYVNADASKTSRSWHGFRIAMREARAQRGTQVHTALTTTESRTFVSGEVAIEILAPPPEQILTGAGGRDVNGHLLDSNAVSVVIRLVHQGHGIALLAGDLDEVRLNSLLHDASDLTADMLIFPHHGGRPGRANGRAFAERLCRAVQPRLVIFSLARTRYENPQPDIVQGVRHANPRTHILCTQLSQRCAPLALTNATFHHLTELPAKGRLTGTCCGGTVLVTLRGAKTVYAPSVHAHRGFIRGQGVPTPLCLQPLKVIDQRALADE